MTGVSNIIIPVSKSRKFQVYKDYEQNTFLKNEIITNLERRIILKEGTIKSSLYKSATQENISCDSNMTSSLLCETAQIQFEWTFPVNIHLCHVTGTCFTWGPT